MLKDTPLLMLVDGHALVHRAYHALKQERTGRALTTKLGEPVHAVFGFTSALLKALQDLRPTHYAISFDRPSPTFRHVEFEAYKAQRPEAPEDLKAQFGRVEEVVQAFNMPVFAVGGFEADDVLGTLARQATEAGVDSVIVTGDTDTMQLVSPHVRVLMYQGRRDETILYSESRVLQRYGLRPAQLPDYKALVGDVSDNIPGVKGVGEKTAVKLLQQFGSLDEVYAHLSEVQPERIRALLETGREQVFRNRRLVTIVTDVPIGLDLEKCRRSTFQRSRVLDLFRDLEFYSLLPRLPPDEPGAVATAPIEAGPERDQAAVAPDGAEGGGEGVASGPSAAGAPVVRAPDTEWRLVTTREQLDALIAELSSVPSFVLDLETTGREAMLCGLVGIALSPAPGRACYVPVGHREGAQLPRDLVLERLRPLLTDPRLAKVAHNGKWDLKVLTEHGVETCNLAFDTMIAAHLLGEKALGLKALAFSKLNIEMTQITELIVKGAKQLTMAEVPVDTAARYAAADADMTGRLATLLEAELRRDSLWDLFVSVEMPLLPVLLRMERVGMCLDTAFLRQLSGELAERAATAEAQIFSAVGHQFNINSPQQLGAVLFEELRLGRGKRTKTGYSTDAAELDRLKGTHPVIALLGQYRELTKIKSTYIDTLPGLIHPRTGRVHTTLHQTATATGRLSSTDPNLQNIPVRSDIPVRRAFVAPAPDWRLLSADYSQIDLRALAHLSQDPNLLVAFQRDEDIHSATAAQVFGVPRDQVTAEMRRVAKTVNFGVIYGMSKYGLAESIDLSEDEAGRFIDSYFERYSGVKTYLEATKQQARDRGYVQTLLGRRRYIPEIKSTNRAVREAAERMAINMPVQGTSADIIKVAMIELQRRMDQAGLRSRMLLQVHDELIFEVPEEELPQMSSLAKEVMSSAVTLSVPVKVDAKVGSNWGQMR